MANEKENNEEERLPLTAIESIPMAIAAMMFLGGLLVILNPFGIYGEESSNEGKFVIGITTIAIAFMIFYGIIILSIRSLKKISRPLVNGKIELTGIDNTLMIGFLISFLSVLSIPVLYLDPYGIIDAQYSYNMRMVTMSLIATLAFASILSTLIIAIRSTKE